MVKHPGSDRLAVPSAFFRLLGYRALGYGKQEAAIRVRSYLHRPQTRQLRLAQLLLAARRALEASGGDQVDLAGHSFGSDTVLMLASSGLISVRSLWLLSPHPPGYLIPRAEYGRLPVERVEVVVGSRDQTRDGVGPFERSLVAVAVGDKARLHRVEGFRHMDFAWKEPLGGYSF